MEFGPVRLRGDGCICDRDTGRLLQATADPDSPTFHGPLAINEITHPDGSTYGFHNLLEGYFRVFRYAEGRWSVEVELFASRWRTPGAERLEGEPSDGRLAFERSRQEGHGDLVTFNPSGRLCCKDTGREIPLDEARETYHGRTGITVLDSGLYRLTDYFTGGRQLFAYAHGIWYEHREDHRA